MSHYDCITQSGKLTASEEAYVTRWIVHSLNSRPQDWTFNGSTCSDQITGVVIDTTRNMKRLRLYRPATTERFSYWNRRRIWKAMHRVRHQFGSPVFNEITKACSKMPLPEPEMRRLPAPTLRLIDLRKAA